MVLRVRVSGTRLPPASSSLARHASRSYSYLPGSTVEVLHNGAWVLAIVSLYGNYPLGTSLRVSIDGGEPTYFPKCDVRPLRARAAESVSSVLSSTNSAKRRRRLRGEVTGNINAALLALDNVDAESAESSNER